MRFLAVLAAAFLSAGVAFGAVVAQLDGPTTYDPNPEAVLLAGRHRGRPKGRSTWSSRPIRPPAVCGTWVTYSGGSVGEYRLQLAGDALQAILWNSGTYCMQWTTPFTDTNDWHSARLAWKEGQETLITLDGDTVNVPNAGTLNDFTSGPGIHKLGGYPSDTFPFAFSGEMRNVTVYDTYERIGVRRGRT